MLRTRILTRTAAATLLVAGAVAATGAPAAAAADADLALTLSGLTVAAEASGKDAQAGITNRSRTATATGVFILFNLHEVDTTKVEVVLPADAAVCTADDQDPEVLTCAVEDLKPGQSADLSFGLYRKDGATGEAGTLTVVAGHDGADPDPSNDAQQAALTIGGSGPDVYSWAWDVPLKADGSFGAVRPGGTAPLNFIVGNQGDAAVLGLKVTVKLPENAAFDPGFEGCEYGAGNRTATCTYSDLVLVPLDQDDDADEPGQQERPFSFVSFEMPVTVAADAKHGVPLTDGLVSAEALDFAGPQALRARAAKLPAGVKGLAQLPAEVDLSDDTDEFSIFVAKADGGQGGGLPVTGPQAALLGGTGGAVVLAGALLYFFARRRRVVLVTPGDEK